MGLRGRNQQEPRRDLRSVMPIDYLVLQASVHQNFRKMSALYSGALQLAPNR